MDSSNRPVSIALGSEASSLSFLKGKKESLKAKDGSELPWDDAVATTASQLAEALGARHICFLLGSGASSLLREGEEFGIPTMGPLAQEFVATRPATKDDPFISESDRTALNTQYGIDISTEPYAKNLEKLMEVLFALRLVLKNSKRKEDASGLTLVESCIKTVKSFVLRRCTLGFFSPFIGDTTVLDIYKAFYRKLVIRDRSLPRPWVFTTNYDLFNETALDSLGLPYCNGFSGTIERRFNPATYRYALAEQLDITERRWSAVDGFVYLCKLHGSVSWIEDDHGLYPIRELQEASSNGQMMIYPTPTKHNTSFGSPYSDLFREFQSRVCREQNVLFTIGYSFGDEHVNNLIYQALTIPTFRLVIFGSPNTNPEIKKLSALDDPRIWIVHGRSPEGSSIHYFESVVKHLLPSLPTDDVDTAISRVVEMMRNPKGPANA